MPEISYECRHIMPSGAKCEAVALKSTPYCYSHTRLHQFKAKPPIGVMDDLHLPFMEDRTAIQVAIAMVLDAFCSSRIDARHCGLLLYGIQIASQNVDHKNPIIPSQTVETITETDTGEELGPKQFICDDDKCFVCPDRDNCGDCELTEEEEEAAQTEIHKQAAANRPPPAVNRPQPTVPCTLPTIHGTVSTTHRAPLHSFTDSPIHAPSSLLHSPSSLFHSFTTSLPLDTALSHRPLATTH
jgi:hypothetical protein